MTNRLLFILIAGLLTTLPLNLFAEGTYVPVKPSDPQPVITKKPHAPVRIPITCSIGRDLFTITSNNPIIINAEIQKSANSEYICSYFSAEPTTVHTFYVEPQNDYLTIDIEVNGTTYTGEFFH